MHSSQHHASYPCPFESTCVILLCHDAIAPSSGHARSLFWAQPVLRLLRFVCHSFVAVLVMRMTLKHNASVQVNDNENFSTTGGKRSGGRKRNSTLIDLLDKVSLFQIRLDMVHLGTTICSASATKYVPASLHTKPHVQDSVARFASIFASNIAKFNACTNATPFLFLAHCSHRTGRKRAGLDTNCWNR